MQDNPDSSGESVPLEAFERSLKELEALVEELETGELNLEASLQKFERGVALARACQHALKNAELRVEQLLQEGGEETLAPYPEDEDT